MPAGPVLKYVVVSVTSVGLGALLALFAYGSEPTPPLQVTTTSSTVSNPFVTSSSTSTITTTSTTLASRP